VSVDRALRHHKCLGWCVHGKLVDPLPGLDLGVTDAVSGWQRLRKPQALLA